MTPENDTPRIERAVAWAVGKALLWLGKRAHDRGDDHEYRHARAELMAGACDDGCRPISPKGADL